MNDLVWKYVKPLSNPKSVENFLQKHHIILPVELLQCLINNNGGRPSEKLFNTNKDEDYVFKALLSYNENDLECIYGIYPSLFEGSPLYPIGSDASGNFVCYDTSSGLYILMKHETNICETIITAK